MLKRALTEPKTALAGVALEISFARSRALIATSNDDRKLSRVFGSLDLVNIAVVEARDGLEEAA